MPTTLDDLADALQVIGSDMDVSGVSVTSFLGRADDRLSFDSTDTSSYLNAINPALSPEPHTHYGSSSVRRRSFAGALDKGRRGWVLLARRRRTSASLPR